MLFWLAKNKIISLASSVIILVISSVAYFAFPNLMGQMNMWEIVGLLFIFILISIGLVWSIETHYLVQYKDRYTPLLNSIKEKFLQVVDLLRRHTSYDEEKPIPLLTDSKPPIDSQPVDLYKEHMNIELLDGDNMLSYVQYDEEYVNLFPEDSTEQLIEKAFEYKTQNLLQNAIDCYIEVLARKPEKELLWQIVIEICSLYKELGEDKLAEEIMNTYINTMESE